MSLKKSALANGDNEQRTNPEVDAKLDQYIKDNPKLYAHYKEMPHEYLVRKQMLSSMRRSEYKSSKDQDIIDLVNDNPELKARVEERVRHLSPERRERAYITAARDEVLASTIRNSQAQSQSPAVAGAGIKP